MRLLSFCLFVAVGASPVMASEPDIVVRWNFNDETLTPIVGSGTIVPLNVSDSFRETGSPQDPEVPNFYYRVSSFPPQGEGNRTAGIEVAVSTAGWEDIVIIWDQRNTHAASKYSRFQYSIDGAAFIDGPLFEMPVGEAWDLNRTVDLSEAEGVADNPLFTFRLVSEFDPATPDTYVPSTEGRDYLTGGQWRFDLLTISGTPLDGPVPLPGDANRDGRVDGEDFLIWQASFGIQEGAAWDDGDFNGDGRVDGEDFLIWQAHFGTVAESSATTPEPGALAVVAAVAGLLMRRRR